MRRFSAILTPILFILVFGVCGAQTETEKALVSIPSVTVLDLPTSETVARGILQKGLDYRSGITGRVNDSEAFRLTCRAAELGDPAAVVLYGALADHTTTYALARKLAGEKMTEACQEAETEDPTGTVAYCVGLAYSAGIGGNSKDDKNATKYFEIGAEKKNLLAMNALGGMLMSGDSGTTNPDRAQRLLEEAVDTGCLRARSNLGRLYFEQGDTTKGLTMLAESANGGESSAAAALGYLHIVGTKDGVIEYDAEQAQKWWEFAMELGDVQSAYNLSKLLRSGEVKPDKTRAIRLLREAAFKNDWTALLELGKLAYDGDGQPKDPAAAYSYWTRAARGGKPEAMYNVSFLLSRGEGVTTNAEEAVVWMRRAADKGLPEALFDLGRLYLLGAGVDRSTTRAAELFESAAAVAAAHGNIDLSERATQAYEEVTGKRVRPIEPTHEATMAGQSAKNSFFGVLALFLVVGIILFYLSRKP